jgi:hypothetical protein
MQVKFFVNRPTPHVLGGAEIVNQRLHDFIQQSDYRSEFIYVEESLDSIVPRVTQDSYCVLTTFHGLSPGLFEFFLNSGVRFCILRHDVPAICYQPQGASPDLRAFFKALFDASRLNVFVSPLQLHMHEAVCAIQSSVVIPPSADLSGFAALNLERSRMLYLGPIQWSRGIREAVTFHAANFPREPFDFIGRVVDNEAAEFIVRSGHQILPEVARKEVPHILNRYRSMVYLPQIVDAFCLKVLEAELCGLEVYSSQDKIGRYHYIQNATELGAVVQFETAGRFLKGLTSTFWRACDEHL